MDSASTENNSKSFLNGYLPVKTEELCQNCKYKEYESLFKVERNEHLGNVGGCLIISVILLGLLYFFGTAIWGLFFKFVWESLGIDL